MADMIDTMIANLTPDQKSYYDEMKRQGASIDDRMDYLISTGAGKSLPNYQPMSEEAKGAFGTIGEAFAPLSSAAWDYTKDMDPGIAKYGIRAAGVAGDVALYAAPVGKIATTAVAGSKFAKPVLKAAGDVAYASHGGTLTRQANWAGKTARSGLEGAIDGAAYGTVANTAKEGELTGPGVGEVAGGAIGGGFVGGIMAKGEKTAASAKKHVNDTYYGAIDEHKETMKQIVAGASGSNENKNFATRITGIKDQDKAIEKVIKANMKEGESVNDVRMRLDKELSEVNNKFDNLMQEHGNLQFSTTAEKIGKKLEDEVRNSVGIGLEQDREIAEYFCDVFNNDLGALARKKLQEKGYNTRQIDEHLFNIDRTINMNNVYKAIDNKLTLGELNEIKKNMWKKTSAFRRNVGSEQEMGKKSTSGQEGGFAILEFLRNYSDKEDEILQKIGGIVDGTINSLGEKYLKNIKGDDMVTGQIIKEYNKLNQQRSKLIGTKRIFDGSFKNLERTGKGDLRIHPESEWDRLAKEKAKSLIAEKNYDVPENMIGVKDPERDPILSKIIAADRLVGQLGQRGGRIMVPSQKNSLGLTPPKQ